MKIKNTSKNIRLSKYVVPKEYDIRMRPDLESFTFEGIETITLKILKKIKMLTLHSKELEIETAEVMLGGEKTFAKILRPQQ